MANGTYTNGNGYILKQLATYGVGSVIGLVAIWQLMARLPALEQSIGEVENTVRHNSSRIIEHDRNLEEGMNELIKLTRGQCLNAADDSQEIARCNP